MLPGMAIFVAALAATAALAPEHLAGTNLAGVEGGGTIEAVLDMGATLHPLDALLAGVLPGRAFAEPTDEFVTTWKTTDRSKAITIPVGGAAGIYSINWGDGTTSENVIGDQTHSYSSAGSYTVRISGDFTRIYLNNDPVNAPKVNTQVPIGFVTRGYPHGRDEE